MFLLIQVGIPCRWIQDSQCFLLEHFDTIYNSPPHIYSYALQFSPPSSWLHKYYTAEPLQEVRVAKGVLADWGTCSRTVSLNSAPLSLAHWRDTIAVGLASGDITILNAIAGNQMAILSGHTEQVGCLVLSLDGTLLVSGGYDRNVKLWDIQTGGVVRTFCGHTRVVCSVSISPDCTTIASGFRDDTIRLWHVQGGDCFHIMGGQNGHIKSISFCPTNSQLFISASEDYTVQQWDINGCQIGPTHEGDGVAFSLDGAHFVSWRRRTARVQNSNSGTVRAELKVSDDDFECCCFSSNGQFVAGGAGCKIYIWDITGSDPHLAETLVGHTFCITSLTFPSSLISASYDSTVKFWKIGAPAPDPVTADAISTSLTPSQILSVSLQVRDGIAISSDSTGVVKTWDILTGLCKTSFHTPAEPYTWKDAQLIDGRLIIVWYANQKIHIWDAEKNQFFHMADSPESGPSGLRISGDGSKVFCLIGRSIQAWSMWTGEAMGRVELDGVPWLDALHVDGSRIWVCFKDSPTQGWDFGISGSFPTLLSNISLDRPRLDFIDNTRRGTSPSIIKDTVTGKEVFQLVGRYAKPTEVRWDGQYLVAGYQSGEVLILEFDHSPSVEI